MNQKQQEVLMKNYGAVEKIVNMVASKFSRQYASRAGRKEMFDEFRSFAWLQVVMAMSRFDDNVGCSVSTFLWGQLWGRVGRYVPTYLSMRQMETVEAAITPEASVVEDGENWKDTWHASPWLCRPDQVLEYKERLRQRRRILSLHAKDMREVCAESEVPMMSNAERQRMFRRRQRAVSNMRTSLGNDKGYFSKFRSDVEQALSHSQVYAAIMCQASYENVLVPQ